MKIAVIGAGNMGGATAWGLLRSNLITAADIHISDPCTDHLKPFEDAGMTIYTNNCQAAKGCDVVMVFVKPWLVQNVLLDLKKSLEYEKQIIVVIAAGVSSENVLGWLRKDYQSNPALMLAIPNIAIAQLSSMTFLVQVSTNDEQTQKVISIFDAMGQSQIVDERLLPAGTTLASCGLAYAMRYVRAASEGGIEMGFYPDDARRIVLQTVKGAVDLLLATGNHPEAEIDKVTTPGGVTIRGLNEMEHAGFTSAVIRGLKAAL